MGLNRIDYPANLTTQADFSQHSELIETRFLDQVTPPLQVVAGVIPQGVVLQIGGAVYRSDSDTTITGTPSDYVRVTPDGATATAAYVSTLAGVSWAKQYAGYYDGSDNLYLFDEGKALAAGDIASVFGRYLAQQENGDVRVGRDLSVGNDLTVTDGATVGGTLNAGNVNTGNGATEIFDMNQDLRTDDNVAFATVNTGQGANKLYDMNQDLRTDDDVTFATVNTGNGATEIFDMNQDLRSDDNVAFATVNTGQGANELYDMNQNVKTYSNVTFNNLTINGGMLPESSPYLGSMSVGSESYDTPSRGLYNSSWKYSHRGSIFGSINNGGDGPYSGNSRTRVRNPDEGYSRTWYYARF